MSRKGHRKPLPPIDSLTDRFGWQSLLDSHVEALKVKGFSEATTSQRAKYIRWFALWCRERDLVHPGDVTKPILERYQRYLFHYRKRNGDPMSFRSQQHHLVVLRMWFRWLARNNQVHSSLCSWTFALFLFCPSVTHITTPRRRGLTICCGTCEDN